MPLDVQLEGLLFYKSSPQKKTALAKVLGVGEEELGAGLEALSARLQSGALRLLITDTDVQLVTAPELSDFITEQRKQELKADIGKAGAETLAIILYKGAVTRAEIDYVRGVNSSYILRALEVRGLITRNSEGNVNRFSVTPQLLAHMGITRREELPDYARILDQLETFVATPAD